MLEKRRKPIELYTAFFVWFMCLLGMGRGGILCSSLLLMGLICYKYKGTEQDIKLLIGVLSIVVGITLIPFMPMIFNRLSTFEVLSKFQGKGMESNSRSEIWDDYLKEATKTEFNKIFGGDNSHTIASRQFNGNTHNTYLNIHVHNGIIPLFIIFVISVKNMMLSIKYHKWIYCLCLVVVLLRGFTDMIFWLNLGTPVLFYLLFYQFSDKSSIRYEHKSESIRKLLAMANI
jgi:O-antigen ligase